MQDVEDNADDSAYAIAAKSFLKLQRALFEHQNLAAHHVESFDEFMKFRVQKIFEEAGDVEVSPDYTRQNDGVWKHARVSFANVKFTKPEWTAKDEKVQPLFPNEARLRKMTYSAALSVDIRMQVYTFTCGDKSKGKLSYNAKSMGICQSILADQCCESVCIGRIPVMVNSAFCQMHGLGMTELLHRGHCYFDVGGYFIIKGSEKVLIAQEGRCKRLWCSQMKRGEGFLARSPTPTKGLSLYVSDVLAYLRYGSVPGTKKTGSFHHRLPYISVRIPYCQGEINAVILFRALGITTDKDLMEIICSGVHDIDMIELIRPSLEAANVMMLPLAYEGLSLDHIAKSGHMKDAALDLLGRLIKHKTINSDEPSKILERCLFPHVSEKPLTKALLLGNILRSLLACALGRRRAENKDDLRNKRLELAGDLFEHQFKSLMYSFRKDLENTLQKVLVKGGDIRLQNHNFDTSRITKGFERAFSTGNWSQPSERMGVKAAGLVVPLDRKNPMATVCHLRQTELKVNFSAMLGEARYQNQSHVGRLCLVQTPDGKSCGLVKNLAITSHISVGSSEGLISKILTECNVKDVDNIDVCDLKSASKVILNGKWIAVHENPKILVSHLRTLRRTNSIPHEVEIVEDSIQNEVRIFCDSGRILRPLIIITENWPFDTWEALNNLNAKGKPKFMDFLAEGIVELLGPEEEASCIIAADLEDVRKKFHSKRFSHCELHPSFMFGVGASFIPFANHNHSTRVLHQSQKHGKQAIGYYTTCLQARCDKSGQNLFYPQRPLVSTMAACFLNKEELSNGQNAIVAVCPFLGFNQEDSIIMNQSSIDRGLFNSIHYQGFCVELDETETLMKPAVSDCRKLNKPSSYDKLDIDGLPYVGADLFPNDIIFGKVESEESNGSVQDSSIPLKPCEKGRADRVILTVDGTEKPVARVILRDKRLPVVGDKFSSLHGQKGVIGATFSEDDLPFTRGGVVPDIIINPHAFPSRQTVGQILETHLAKAAAIGGQKHAATPFNNMSIESMRRELHRLGYESWGKEAMIHGQTGQVLQASVFIGPAFYQRLLKMAEDQLKYRRQGPTHPLTHQPLADRRRHGGVKIGEMERDCLLAHGASANIHERLFSLSDPYTMHICQACEMMATEDTRGHKCRFCKTSKHIVQVHVPYACKWLYQELLSMGICLRFETEIA